MIQDLKRTAISLICLATALSGSTAWSDDETVIMERAPSGHFLLPVQINNGGPYTFLFDTGASHTAIAQPVAESLGFQSVWAQTGDVQSLTTRFEAERFALNSLQFARSGPVQINSVVIPAPEDSANPVVGLLGADAITSDQYSVDFSTGTLYLSGRIPEYADGTVNPLGLLLSDASVRRGISHINVIIDSGSARSIVNERLARYMRQRSHTVRFNINGVDDDIDMEAAPVTMRRFMIGGLCMNSFVALQADLDVFDSLGWTHEPAIVLGMDVLQYTTIRVDRETGRVQIDAAGDGIDCRR